MILGGWAKLLSYSALTFYPYLAHLATDCSIYQLHTIVAHQKCTNTKTPCSLAVVMQQVADKKSGKPIAAVANDWFFGPAKQRRTH